MIADMPTRKKKSQPSRTAPLLVLAIVILAGIWSVERIAERGIGPAWLQFLFAAEGSTGGLHVGLVAGHSGSDSGAVCENGLTEAEVNLRVAQEAAKGLRRHGVFVDILEEFDPRLQGFKADAFLSIHADSCEVDFSGFKVASAEDASDESKRLTTCLWDEYEAVTELERHPSTITLDMTRYHAFRRIDPNTPGAIIEVGFLNADRALLTERPQVVADGIVNGVLCFLSPAKSPAR